MSATKLIKFDSDTSIKVHHMKKSHTIFDWHKHQCFELIMVIGGEQTRFIDQTVHKANSNEIILIPPFTSHTWESFTEAQEIVVVLFEPDLLTTNIPELSQMSQLLNDTKAVLRLDIDPLRDSHTLVNPLLNLKESTRFDRLISLLQILKQFSNQCSIDSLHHTEQTDSKPAKLLHKIRTGREDIRLNDCAEILNMSESTFKRWVNDEFECSFTALVQNIKTDQAKQLLACTSKPISLVSEEIGYSIRAFNSLFKKQTGMTPSQFRKNNQWKLKHNLLRFSDEF